MKHYGFTLPHLLVTQDLFPNPEKGTFSAHWGNPSAEDILSHKRTPTLLFQLQENLPSRKMQATNFETLHSSNTARQGFHSNQTRLHSIIWVLKQLRLIMCKVQQTFPRQINVKCLSWNFGYWLPKEEEKNNVTSKEKEATVSDSVSIGWNTHFEDKSYDSEGRRTITQSQGIPSPPLATQQPKLSVFLLFGNTEETSS